MCLCTYVFYTSGLISIYLCVDSVVESQEKDINKEYAKINCKYNCKKIVRVTRLFTHQKVKEALESKKILLSYKITIKLAIIFSK